MYIGEGTGCLKEELGISWLLSLPCGPKKRQLVLAKCRRSEEKAKKAGKVAGLPARRGNPLHGPLSLAGDESAPEDFSGKLPSHKTIADISRATSSGFSGAGITGCPYESPKQNAEKENGSSLRVDPGTIACHRRMTEKKARPRQDLIGGPAQALTRGTY